MVTDTGTYKARKKYYCSIHKEEQMDLIALSNSPDIIARCKICQKLQQK